MSAREQLLYPRSRRPSLTRRLWHRAPEGLRKEIDLRVRKSRFGVEAVRNRIIDRRYGGNCGGRVLGRLHTEGMFGTTSADYVYLRRLFDPRNGVTVHPRDVLVDVGCGKGRVINAWLDMGFENRMFGIELDPDVAAMARHRLAGRRNVEIRTGNALECLPDEATLLFLFNPFSGRVLTEFRDRLEAQFPPGRPLTIVYYMALFVEVFMDRPGWVVERSPARTFHPAFIVRRTDHVPTEAVSVD